VSILGRFSRSSAQPRVAWRRVVDIPRHSRVGMVLKVLTDPGQMLHDRDAVSLQFARSPRPDCISTWGCGSRPGRAPPRIRADAVICRLGRTARGDCGCARYRSNVIRVTARGETVSLGRSMRGKEETKDRLAVSITARRSRIGPRPPVALHHAAFDFRRSGSRAERAASSRRVRSGWDRGRVRQMPARRCRGSRARARRANPRWRGRYVHTDA